MTLIQLSRQHVDLSEPLRLSDASRKWVQLLALLLIELLECHFDRGLSSKSKLYFYPSAASAIHLTVLQQTMNFVTEFDGS